MIDAVVTWVDGSDPQHRSKIHQHSSLQYINSNNYNAQFVSSDEILYCIHSIYKFVEDIRNVYVVTDNQDPRAKFPSLQKFKSLRIVDHTEIFRGYESFLPVFSPRPIETLLWRIEDLLDDYIYLNDDCFIVNNISRAFFFNQDKRKCFFHSRRNWSRRNPATFRRFYGLYNGFRLLSTRYSPQKFLLPAHHPCLQTVRKWEELFEEFGDGMIHNLRHKFRNDEDFIPNALYQNYLVWAEGAEADFSAIGAYFGEDCRDTTHIEALRSIVAEGRKFVCFNSFQRNRDIEEIKQIVRERVGIVD